MKEGAILIGAMFLLSIVAGGAGAVSKGDYGILIVDSNSSVLIPERGLNFTAPAWVELPASKDGENYTAVIRVNGMEVKIPVRVKEGLTTIVKLDEEELMKAIISDGANPSELEFGESVTLPPKLPGSQWVPECGVATYGPVKGNGPPFEVAKVSGEPGYFLLFNNTPFKVCNEYEVDEIKVHDDSCGVVGHRLNWTSYVPKYMMADVDSDPPDSAILIFGASLMVLRTPLTLSLPVINESVHGYGFDFTGNRVDFEVKPIEEYPITITSNITSFNGLAPRVSFIVKPSPEKRIRISVNFTRILDAVNLRVVYGIPPEYRNLPNGMNETHGGTPQNNENEEGNIGNETFVTPTPENATLIIETHPKEVEVYVDGNPVCRGGCTLNLTPGEHGVEGRAMGFVKWSKSVVLSPGERVTLNVTLLPYPRFRVVSVPEGAELFVDGKPLNCTTPCNVTLTPGTHELVFKKEGFRDYKTRVEVHAGDSGVIPVSLTDLSGRRYSLDPRIKGGNQNEEIQKKEATKGLSLSPTTAYVLGGLLILGAGLLVARKL
ncbi:hypothetical protein A3L12_08105 [Thermococcus sp. P6]|nr:hypothetical protein A3L12_08105 [Thermococcus sp. P6]